MLKCASLMKLHNMNSNEILIIHSFRNKRIIINTYKIHLIIFHCEKQISTGRINNINIIYTSNSNRHV